MKPELFSDDELENMYETWRHRQMADSGHPIAFLSPTYRTIFLTGARAALNELGVEKIMGHNCRHELLAAVGATDGAVLVRAKEPKDVR